MKKFITISLICLFPFAQLFSQEILSQLQNNPVLVKKAQQTPHFKAIQEDKAALSLPFFDDFREMDPYPTQKLWVDSFAYVNRNIQMFPPNIGVATFDAINQYGKIYPDASPFLFVADYLTSQPIRLDSVFGDEHRPLMKKDSLYFSFYYQPQGRGNDPQVKDSLVLEFLLEPEDTLFTPNDTILVEADTIWDFEGNIVEIIPEHDSIIEYDPIILEAKWQRIWSVAGMKIDTFYKYVGDWNQQVLIPIQDSALFYRNDFQFRFYNYASLADETLPSWQSNADNWNIDYVYLNINRSAADSMHTYIGFSEKPESFLKYYEAMPYSQYSNDPTNEMRDTVHNYITNLDTTTYLGNYEYKVLKSDGSPVFSYDGGNYPIYPYYEDDFVTHPAFAKPPVEFILPVDPFGTNDSVEFIIRHIVNSDITPSLSLGDTVDFVQKMTNYYAYDDGSAEAGYGLSPAGAKLAYRFQINHKDTIRAVDFFFNHTLSGGNEHYFNLSVWSDNNGIPGELLNTAEVVKPVFEDGINTFVRYYLDEAVAVRNSFYVGWIQTTDDNLNVGFDRNRNNQENIYYMVDDEWFTSQYEGSLMIRPVMGKQLIEYSVKEGYMPDNISVFPNPLPSNNSTLTFTETVYNDRPERTQYVQVEIFNMMGRKVYSAPWSKEINTGEFPSGVYIIRVTDTKTTETQSLKFVKGTF